MFLTTFLTACSLKAIARNQAKAHGHEHQSQRKQVTKGILKVLKLELFLLHSYLELIQSIRPEQLKRKTLLKLLFILSLKS